MKKLLFLFLTISLLTACNDNNPRGFNNRDGDSGGWTNKLRNKYLKECIDQAGDNAKLAKQVCSCVLEKVEKKYTVQEAEALSEAVGTKLARECMNAGGELGNEEEDDFGYRKKKDDDDYDYDQGGSWSKRDRNAFLNPCEDGMVRTGYTAAQARQLCNCALGNLEKKYPSLQNANERGGEQAGASAMRECMGGGGDDNYDYDNN